MSTWIKKIIFVVLILAAGFAGHFIGYMQGTIVGSAENLNSDASTRAYANVSTLKKLRNGEMEKAVSFLEFQLDTAIQDHGIWLRYHQNLEKDKWYTEKTDLTKKSMVEVSAYRKKYPSKHIDPEMKAQIEKVVGRYSE